MLWGAPAARRWRRPSSGRTGARPACAQRWPMPGTKRCSPRAPGCLDPYFSGTKLKWLLDTLPGAGACRARRACLRHHRLLAGLAIDRGRCHVTDASNASRTLLFDIHRRCWDDARAGAARHPARGAAAGGRQCRRRRHDGQSSAWRRAAAGGAGRRPAGGQLRPDLPAAEDGEEHLRHRLFLLMHTGSRPVASRHRLLATVGWQRRAPPAISSKAACSWAAPSCSGCATAWA